MPESKSVFISYSSEDRDKALKIYEVLKNNGYNPWIDIYEIKPGENWNEVIINEIISKSDYFIACFSNNMSNKHGYIHKEIRIGLSNHELKPPGTLYFIPIKLDNSEIGNIIVNTINLKDFQFAKLLSNNDIELFVTNLKNYKLKYTEKINIISRNFSYMKLIIAISVIISFTVIINAYIKNNILDIDNINIVNTDTMSRNILVDLDPIVITWTSTGMSKEIFVVLENAETGKQTSRKRVQSTEGKITFKPNQYKNFEDILTNRKPLESNRIRAIFYSSSKSFISNEFEIKVGVKILVIASLPNIINSFAIVDNTICNYQYIPIITLFSDKSFKNKITLRGDKMKSQFKFEIPDGFDIEPSTFIFTLESKSDDRIVRSEIDLSEFYKVPK